MAIPPKRWLVFMFILPVVIACRGDNDAPAGDMATTDFPQVAGARQIAGAPLSAEQVSFKASDPVATLHAIGGEVADVMSYYNSGLLDDGWKGGGIGRNEYVEYDVLAKGGRVAVVTVTSSRVRDERPAAWDTIDFGPLADEADHASSDQALVYMQYGTCAEPAVEDCMQEAFMVYQQKLQAARQSP